MKLFHDVATKKGGTRVLTVIVAFHNIDKQHIIPR